MGPILITTFLVLWAAGWILARSLLPPSPPPPSHTHTQKPSLIIPARNEAHNLPRLLASLSPCRHLLHEVIVADDNSTDPTAATARAHGATVVSCPPQPTGWRGKTWACHQGALAATGPWLFFLDADTWLQPGGLENLLALNPPGALSVGPYHAVQQPYEQLSLFFNLCMTLGTIPHGLAGQALLVRSSDYHSAGGHAAVRNDILENFRLAHHFHQAGIPTLAITGKHQIHFRMYPHGLRELIQGWSKGFASGSSGTPKPTLILIIAWLSCLTLPPTAALLTHDWPTWTAAYLAATLQLAVLARRSGSFSPAAIALFPIPLTFFFILFLINKLFPNRKISWKGRPLHDH